jgi:hypothetical protein
VTIATRPDSASLGSASVDDLHSGLAQFLNRAVTIARRHLDGAGRSAVDDHVEAGQLRVKRGRLDAVVEREPADVNSVNVVLAQQPLERRVLKTGVALGVARAPGIDDVRYP